MAHLAEGHELGPLKIIRLLGSGGMADVYEAEDTRLGRRVAVKVLPQEYSRNQDFITRFEREVKASAALSHSNIVTVFEFGSIEGLNYYTMRLLPGGDLREKIAKGMTLVDVLRTLRGVLQAFQHAHARGFVHRDVKPENIMFDDQGTPILTDFGIAKALDSHTRMTQTGMAVGTPRYISPEQAMGKDVDGRSDLYSLGCILYEMLTGSVPYKADTPIATIFQHVNEPVPTLDEEFATFRELLDKLMAKSPDDRFQDATQALAALDSSFPSDWTGTFTASSLPVVEGGGARTPAATPIRPNRTASAPKAPQSAPPAGEAAATQVLTPGSADAYERTQLLSGQQAQPRAREDATQLIPQTVQPSARPRASSSSSGSKNNLPWLIGIIVLLALGAALAWYLTQPKPSQPTVGPALQPTAEPTADDAAERQAQEAAAQEEERRRQEAAEQQRRRKEAEEAFEKERQRKAAEAAEQDRRRKAAAAAEEERRRKAAAEAAEQERQRQAREDAARRKALEEQRARDEAAEEQRRKAAQATPAPTAAPVQSQPTAEELEAEAERRRAREAEQRRQQEAAARARREQQAREEAERLQREEAERQAQLEAERRAREEAERQAQEEAERKEKMKKPVPIGF